MRVVMKFSIREWDGGVPRGELDILRKYGHFVIILWITMKTTDSK